MRSKYHPTAVRRIHKRSGVPPYIERPDYQDTMPGRMQKIQDRLEYLEMIRKRHAEEWQEYLATGDPRCLSIFPKTALRVVK